VTAIGHDDVMDTKMIKTIGEHWVCATLARYGWAPVLTRDGLERTDILAVNTDLHHRPVVEIQVKTASQRGAGTNWLLGTKAQFLAKSAHEWFALGLLAEIPAIPKAFVVPRDHLSAAAWIAHQDWRADPSVSPGIRNTGLDQARVSWPVWLGYEDNWGLLGIPTKEVPVLLPPKLRGRTGHCPVQFAEQPDVHDLARMAASWSGENYAQ
jgi:hypothetical protein